MFFFFIGVAALTLDCQNSLCPSNFIGNSYCDTSCMIPACNYDSYESIYNSSIEIMASSDCLQACLTENPGCLFSMLNDGTCNQECNTDTCGWDLGDCGVCAKGCTSDLLGNGICNEACNNQLCRYDLNDCGWCKDGCYKNMLDNSVCNDECFNSQCDYDGTDCGCAEGCKTENYGNCDNHCLVPECGYDSIGTQTCNDHYKRTYNEYWQLVNQDFTSFFDIGNSGCTESVLKQGVDGTCSTECQDKFSAYQMGGCSKNLVCGENCSVCGTQNDCLKCKSGYINYYTECVSSCPTCYETNSAYPSVCVRNFYIAKTDKSTYSDPTVIYIDTNSQASSPDGSKDSPYRYLSTVFYKTSFCDKNLEIRLKPGTYPITNLWETSFASNTTIKFLTDCDSCGEFATLKLQIQNFTFPVTNLLSLYFVNIVIDGQQALDSSCNKNSCEYCQYSSSSENNGAYVSYCTFSNVNLIDISNTGNLYMINTTIQHMRVGCKSLINSNGGKIRLYNVNFQNLKVMDSTSGNQYSVIKIECDSSTWCSDTFYYIYGSVSLLNNGYTYYTNIQQSSFLYAKYSGNIKISYISFTNNLVLCGSGVTDYCGSLIYIYNCEEQVTIQNNIFDTNYAYAPLVYLKYEDWSLNYDYVTDGVYKSFSTIIFANNKFTYSGSDQSLLKINLNTVPINIEDSGNIYENSITNSKIIDIENLQSIPTYSIYGGTTDVMNGSSKVKVTVSANYITFKKLSFTDCYSPQFLNLNQHPSINMTSVSFDWNNGLTKNDIDTLVISRFVSNGYLPAKFGIFSSISTSDCIHVTNLYYFNATTLSIDNTSLGSSSHFVYAKAQTGINITKVTANNINFSNDQESLLSIFGDALTTNCSISQVTYKNVSNSDSVGGIELNEFFWATLDLIEMIDVSAKGEGGGIYAENVGVFIISNSNFDNAKSEKYGGSIYYAYSTSPISYFSMMNCTFNQGSASLGGALYITAENSIVIYIYDSKFTKNYAGSGGNAIYIPMSTTVKSATINKCTFEENYGYSGTVSLYHSGLVSITDSLFQKNTASPGPSAIYGFFESAGNLISLENDQFLSETGVEIINLLSTISGSAITTKNCTFSDNENIVLQLTYFTWTDTQSKFISNWRSVFAQGQSELYLTGTNFSENSGYQNSAGTSTHSVVDILWSSINCTECTFYKNNEHALYIASSSVANLTFCNFIENYSKTKGSALVFNSNHDNSALNNTYFAFNSANQGGTIYIIETTMLMMNLTMKNNTSSDNSPGIIVSGGDIAVINSTFINQTASYQGAFIDITTDGNAVLSNCVLTDGISTGGGAITNSGSSVSVYSSKFIFNTLVETASGIYGINNCKVTVDSSSFLYKTYQPSNMGFSIYLQNSYMYVSDTLFDSYVWGAIYGYSMLNMTIKNSIFQNGKNSLNAIYSYQSTTTLITDSSFLDSSTTSNGAAIYLADSQDATIKRCIFNSNSAGSGGAIYFQNANPSISYSNFTNNKADYDGGAIKIYCEGSYGQSCGANIFNSNFINNSASRSGGAIYWTGDKPDSTNNVFSNNSAIYGDDWAAYPVRIALVTSDGNISSSRILTDFTSIASGQKFTDTIYIGLIDSYDQITSLDFDTYTVSVKSTANVSASGTIDNLPISGIVTFDNIYITSTPGTSATLSFSADTIGSITGYPSSETSTEANLGISITMRECEKGEFYNDNKCDYCQAGTYSYNINRQCENCPNNAVCYGGYLVAPDSGHWHGSNDSATIYECLNTGACLGGIKTTTEDYYLVGRCATGYKGNLCQACDEGYSSSGTNTCGKCPDDVSNAIKLVGIGIIIIIVLVIMVRSSLRSAYEEKSVVSIYIKILINYIQLISLVSQLDLSWPFPVSELINAQSKTGEISTQMFSFDCFLIDKSDKNSYKDIYFTKLIIIAIIPAILGVILTVFWLLVAFFKKNKRVMKEEYVASCCILFFLIHPSLTSYLFSIFNCKNLYGDSYLVKNLDIQCWDHTHTYYTLCTALPGIVVWSIGVPYLILLYLIRKRKKIHKLAHKLRLGFLYNGYRDAAYYWEFVILARKLSIICLTVFLNSVSIKIQALGCFSVILVFLYMQFQNNPFTLIDLNESELRGVLVSAFTIYCGLFYLTGDLDTGGKWFFFLVIVISNAYFLYFWLRKMGYESATMAVKFMPDLEEAVIKGNLNNYKETVKRWKANIVEDNKIDKDWTRDSDMKVENMEDLYLLSMEKSECLPVVSYDSSQSSSDEIYSFVRESKSLELSNNSIELNIDTSDDVNKSAPKDKLNISQTL